MALGASKKRPQLNWLKKGYCPSKFCVHSSYGSGDIVFNLPCHKDVISTCERVINQISCGRDNSCSNLVYIASVTRRRSP